MQLSNLQKNETVQSYFFLFRWIGIAVAAGSISTTVVHAFKYLLDYASRFTAENELPFAVWPLIGAVFAGAVLFRIEPKSSGEGIPSYIRGINRNRGYLKIMVTIFKFWSAIVTLATFGNGGVVGPIGRVSSGLVSIVVEKLKEFKLFFATKDIRTAAICGMAGALGAIFHTSIGGGIFAVEILAKENMRYKDLFPAILASATGVFVCKTAGWESFYNFNVPDKFMDIKYFHWLIIISLLAGLLGAFYEWYYRKMTQLFKRQQGRIVIKTVIGALLAYTLASIINPDLLGTSSKLIPAMINGNFYELTGNLSGRIPLFLIILIVMFTKVVGNCILVGCGMSAGFTGPTIISGMLLGTAFAVFLGIAPGTATYYAFLCAGFSGVLGSAMNIPLAGAVMAVELFGLQYSVAAAFAAVIGFQMTRHTMIYDIAMTDSE
ncbi:MAG: chloride channel protein [Planctomycetota bacterium]|jgi:CIC family chloride channel protein